MKNIQNVSVSGLRNLPPENIFSTALTSDGDNNIELQWPPISLASSSYYLALYFADLSNGNSQTFDVFINEYTFYHNLEVSSFSLFVFADKWNQSGPSRINLWSESAPHPIISAGEVFGVFSLGKRATTRDGINNKHRDLTRFSNLPMPSGARAAAFRSTPLASSASLAFAWE